MHDWAKGFVLSAVVVAGAAAPARAQPRYSIVELSGVPAALNDNGEIAGWVYVGADAHAAVYRGGAWQDLGVPAGDQLSALFGINSQGAAAGYSFLATSLPAYPFSDNRWQAIWAPAGASAVQALSVLAPDSFNYGINDSNAIVGCRNRYDDEYPDPYRAYLYANGIVTDLHGLLFPPLAQTRYDLSCALDINNAGDVVGEVDPDIGDKRGFLFRNGAVTRLVGGTSYVRTAKAINDTGRIVGEGWMSGFTAHHAVVYESDTGTISTLGVESTGVSNSRPNDVNAAGDVVGTMFSPVFGDHAFLVKGGQVFDLNDLIPADSGWVLQEAQSINARGQIVGRGYLTPSPGVTRYFLLDAVTPREAIDGLTADVMELQASGEISNGTATSLIAKLDAAAKDLDKGNLSGAVGSLESFVSHVDTYIRTGKIDETAGQALIDDANRVIGDLLTS